MRPSDSVPPPEPAPGHGFAALQKGGCKSSGSLARRVTGTEREALTSERQFEGDFGLGQQGLHMAPEELQGFALAPARVQKHQHAAGPWEPVRGSARC